MISPLVGKREMVEGPFMSISKVWTLHVVLKGFFTKKVTVLTDHKEFSGSKKSMNWKSRILDFNRLSNLKAFWFQGICLSETKYESI